MPYVIKIRSTQTSLVDVVRHKKVHIPNNIDCVEFYAYANETKMQAFCGTKQINVGEIVDGQRITRYHKTRFNNPVCNNRNSLATFLNSADDSHVIVEIVAELEHDEGAKELRNLLIRQAYNTNNVLCLNQEINAGVHGKKQSDVTCLNLGQHHVPSLQSKVNELLSAQVRLQTSYRPSLKSKKILMNYYLATMYGLRIEMFPINVAFDISDELNKLTRNTLTEFEIEVRSMCFDYAEPYIYWNLSK